MIFTLVLKIVLIILVLLQLLYCITIIMTFIFYIFIMCCSSGLLGGWADRSGLHAPLGQPFEHSGDHRHAQSSTIVAVVQVS